MAIVVKSLDEYVTFLQKQCREEDILFRGQQRCLTLLPKVARIAARDKVLQSERNMFAEFKRRMRPYLDIQPADDWESLSIAQHHGMATRLLDWTKNPLAALWFAVREPPCQGERGVVWVFRFRRDQVVTDFGESPLVQYATRVYCPSEIAPSMCAQQAWFTVHGYSKKAGRFIPLDENQRFSSQLTNVLIDPNVFHEVRFQLDRCGVNEASMFPTIGGLCRHLEWLHSFLPDEQDERITAKRRV